MLDNSLGLGSKVNYVVLIAAVVVSVVAILFILTPSDGSSDGPSSTENLEASEKPHMQLFLLEGNENFDEPVAEFESGNSEFIQLEAQSHIRFDSSDYREPDGIHVLAKNIETGKTEVLRRSYYVNNEFFVFLRQGEYQFQVLASWPEKGNFQYNFNVAVV